MTHWTNYAVEIQDTDDVAPTIIGSISTASNPIDSDIQQSNTGGTYYPEHISIAGVDPRSTFTTFDIEKLLDNFGVVGNNIVGDAPEKVGYAFYQAEYENGILASVGHRRLRMPRSYFMNRQITAGHRVDAEINCECWGLYDLTNNPMIPDSNITLPALPPSPGRWTLGKVTIAGSDQACLTDLTIDFGINPTLFGCNSDEFNSKLSLDSIQPTITFTSLDMNDFNEVLLYKLRGLCGTHVDTEFYLRKRTDCGAGFEDDAELVHIKMTAAGVLTIADAHTASGNSRGEMQIQMTCRWDGTNSPIKFTTKSAIT